MPKPGDKVAVVSPSRGLPELFPAPYELGLRRLREDFGLVPVEYPTTRRLRSSPRERAADLHAAFADPDITAVIATIGGDDQITVLKYLDPDLLRANPKPFFGYSDNTNLLNYLHHLGLTSYHGGAVMVQFGRGGAMHPDSEASLRAAGTGWEWHHAETVVEGNLWGGCLEIIDWQLAASRWMRPVEEYDGVLFCETSEELPSATAVYRMLRSAGERGLLAFRRRAVGAAEGVGVRQPADRGRGHALRRRPVRRCPARAGRVQPGRDAGHGSRHRPHGSAAGAAVRRMGPRGRARPPHHRALLSHEIPRRRPADYRTSSPRYVA